MKSNIIALLLALMAFGLSGCGDSHNGINQISGQQGNSVTPQPTPEPTPVNEGYIRIAQLALREDNFDVLVNGTEVQSDTEGGEVTNYFKVPAGQTRVQVRVSGSENDLLSQNITVTTNTYQTVAVLGDQPGGENELPPAQLIPGIKLLVLTDRVNPVISTGVSVRFVNAIPHEEGAGAQVETAEREVLAGPQDFSTASGYVDFTRALAYDYVVLSLPAVDGVYRYSTSVGTVNRPIFTLIREALGGQPGNITIFVTGDDDALPAVVVIDRASRGGEAFTFLPDPNET